MCLVYGVPATITQKNFLIHFITSAYGNNYIGFLLNTIYSITQSQKNYKITVYWEDIDEQYITMLRRTFPLVEFTKTDFNIEGDPFKRISSKTLFWEKAVIDHPGELLCLIDSDVLVIKDIGAYFNQNFDVGFTYKNETFPLNSGVMLIKNYKEEIKNFFKKWKEETLSIFNSDELMAVANSLTYPYGGGDQMSLYKMLGYEKGKDSYRIICLNKQLVFKGFPCSQLNETRSKNVSGETHIIHYKGGWRKIIADGENFTHNRSKKNSWEMYILFIRSFQQALMLVDNSSKNQISIRYGDAFGIYLPEYLDHSNFKINKIKYFIHYLVNMIKKVIKKIT